MQNSVKSCSNFLKYKDHHLLNAPLPKIQGSFLKNAYTTKPSLVARKSSSYVLAGTFLFLCFDAELHSHDCSWEREQNRVLRVTGMLK